MPQAVSYALDRALAVRDFYTGLLFELVDEPADTSEEAAVATIAYDATDIAEADELVGKQIEVTAFSPDAS